MKVAILDVDAVLTSDDVSTTRPAPDLRCAALEQVAGEALVVGDSIWDAEAAGNARMTAVGVLCGGFSEAELRQPGAVAVFDGPAELAERLRELLDGHAANR